MTETLETVSDLNIFPIKSAQAATIDGLPVTELEVVRTGFQKYDVHDREFVVVEAEPLDNGDYLFVSQRGWDEHGKPDRKREADRLLATLQTDISEDFVTLQSLVGTLRLQSRHKELAGPRRHVRIHGSTMWNVIDQGEEPAEYLSELLGRSVRLMRDGRLTRRLVEKAYRTEFGSNAVAGADGFPFLLVNEASLAQAHLDQGLELGTVPIDRYRGNIVVGGDVIGAWGEDYLRRIQIGKTVMEIAKACSRCPIPDKHQQSGERVGGGLAVLRGHKGLRSGDTRPQPLFGQNLNHHYIPGQIIRVGDPIVVRERADEPNFLAA